MRVRDALSKGPLDRRGDRKRQGRDRRSVGLKRVKSNLNQRKGEARQRICLQAPEVKKVGGYKV